MMLSYLLLLCTLYLVWSFNLSCLVFLIEQGYFSHKFWTRSLRSTFVMPPFAIFVFSVIFFKESVCVNWENLKMVMTKRKD